MNDVELLKLPKSIAELLTGATDVASLDENQRQNAVLMTGYYKSRYYQEEVRKVVAAYYAAQGAVVKIYRSPDERVADVHELDGCSAYPSIKRAITPYLPRIEQPMSEDYLRQKLAKMEEREIIERKCREKIESEWQAVREKGEPIEASVENIRAMLKFFNLINWGCWDELPDLTIGYTLTQHNCDGHTVTAIKLNSPIDGVSKYRTWAPNGYLMNYIGIR